MTHFFLVILLTACILLSAFLVCLLVVRSRPRYRHYASPESISTPLGYYSAQQDRRVAHGTPGKRAYQPGDESVDTVKVSTPEGKR